MSIISKAVFVVKAVLSGNFNALFSAGFVNMEQGDVITDFKMELVQHQINMFYEDKERKSNNFTSFLIRNKADTRAIVIGEEGIMFMHAEEGYENVHFVDRHAKVSELTQESIDAYFA